jgi:nucleoside 2-deoxyribosyltransferase
MFMEEEVYWHKGNGHSYRQTDFPILDLNEIPGPDFFRLCVELNRGMMYLASPYSSNWRVSKEVAKERKEKVIAFTDTLLDNSIWVFSPIAYGATFEERGFEHSNAWWMRRDFEFLKHCDILGVYCLEGWEESPGVTKEIDWALTLNKKVLMLVG